MIKYLKGVSLILLFACCFEVARAQQPSNPDSLLKHKQFFVLRELINKSDNVMPEFQRAYFTAFINNFFNKPGQSINDITLLQNKYAGKLSVEKRIELLKLKQDNDLKLFDYRAAYEHTQQLLTDFGPQLTKDDKEDAENSIIIWKNLIGIKQQQTLIQKDTRITTARDIAGLMTIPIAFGVYQDTYVFDTGANISVITESNAKKAQLQMVGDAFQVDAITGIKIKARTGVCPELKIGDLTVRNVVFMVFPDSALSFAGGKYTINGIIGFPVIASMNEVHINKAGYMDIPVKSTVMPVHNFGLDGLTPVVNLDYKGTTLPFTFDTGAQVTQLNRSFYDLYKSEIQEQGVASEIKMGGAGGANSLKGYNLPAISFKLFDQSINLTNIHIKTSTVVSKDNYYFGNLGQDAFNKFNELLINFEHMYVMLLNTN